MVENETAAIEKDAINSGREDHFMDVDRMINEGLGGGNVTLHNGLIDESTTDTMNHADSVLDTQE